MLFPLKNARVAGLYVKVLRPFPEIEECVEVANLIKSNLAVSEFRVEIEPNPLVSPFLQFWGISKTPEVQLVNGDCVAPTRLEVTSRTLVVRRQGAKTKGKIWEVFLQIESFGDTFEALIGGISQGRFYPACGIPSRMTA